jgi:hypothetical protein
LLLEMTLREGELQRAPEPRATYKQYRDDGGRVESLKDERRKKECN